jgi:hypothetical protein
MRVQGAPPWTVRVRLYYAPHKVPAEWRQWAVDEIHSGRYRRNRPYYAAAVGMIFVLMGVALGQPLLLMGLGGLAGAVLGSFVARRASERMALEAVVSGKSWLPPARPRWWPAVAGIISSALLGFALYMSRR